MNSIHPLKENASERENHGKILKFRWHIPAYPSFVTLSKIKRSNRYLKHQNIKISQLIVDKKYDKAIKEFR